MYHLQFCCHTRLETKTAKKTYSKAKTSSKTNDEKSASEANSSQADRAVKLFKLVEKAKTTDMWCLSRFVLTMQEAMAKQMKICPINLRGGGVHGRHMWE
jgi:hypothetical protein